MATVPISHSQESETLQPGIRAVESYSVGLREAERFCANALLSGVFTHVFRHSLLVPRHFPARTNVACYIVELDT